MNFVLNLLEIFAKVVVRRTCGRGSYQNPGGLDI
jgi:hypothetical protein